MTPVLDRSAEPLAQLRAHLGQESIRIVPRAQDRHRDQALVAGTIGRGGDGGKTKIVDRAATIAIQHQQRVGNRGAPCAKLREVQRRDKRELCESAAGSKGTLVEIRCCEQFEECAPARYKRLSIHQPQVCNVSFPGFVDKNAFVQLVIG